MKELRDRVAVVTGAASGIGYGMAERFCAEGMKVVLADIEEAPLEEAEGKLRAAGGTVIGIPCDVSKPDHVQHVAERALGAFGAVHVLCNNAGVAGRGTTWEMTREDWDWVLGVNLNGVVNGIRSFMPILLEQPEAHVVNTASVAGLVTGVLASYSVTKHAVVALSEALHLELQMRGANVGVSVLCPGWVKTNIINADRNRPAGLPEPLPNPMQDAGREMVKQLTEQGMAPSEVARQVVEAIQTGKFYILTHPEMMAGVKTRHDDIQLGRSPTMVIPR